MENWYRYTFELRWEDDPTHITVSVVTRNKTLAWLLAGQLAGSYSPPIHSLTYVSNYEVQVVDA